VESRKKRDLITEYLEKHRVGSEVAKAFGWKPAIVKKSFFGGIFYFILFV
jgi:hypothetical protein